MYSHPWVKNYTTAHVKLGGQQKWCTSYGKEL